jgi:hypothetical protein
VRLVITQNFARFEPPLSALKGRWKLAGGETTGRRAQLQRAPAGAPDGVLNYEIFFSLRPVRRPCRGAKAITTGYPVVSPPANFRCASGAKSKSFG